MKTQSCVQLLDQKSSKKLLINFFTYLKSCALNLNQLQTHKRELFKRLKSINVIIIFSEIDKQKKNAIFQKDLKKFLMQHNIIVKQKSLNLFFEKYTKPGQIYLDYQDFLNTLLPKDKFTPLKLTHDHCRQKINYYDSEKKTLSKMSSLIIGSQINFIGLRHDQLNNLINNSLQKSAQLWRLLDFQHINNVNFYNIQKLNKQLNFSIKSNQWLAFVVWNLNKSTEDINRDDFIMIFNKLIEEKKICSQFNLEKFRQRNLAKNKLIINEKRRVEQEDLIRKKLVNIEISYLAGIKNAESIGKGLQEWAQMIKIIKKDNNQKYKQQIFKTTKNSSKGIKKPCSKVIKTQCSFSYSSPKKYTSSSKLQRSNSAVKTRSSSAYKASQSISFSKFFQNNQSSILKKSNSLMKTSSSLNNSKTFFSKSITPSLNKNIVVLDSFIGYQVPKSLIKSCLLKKQDLLSSFKKRIK